MVSSHYSGMSVDTQMYDDDGFPVLSDAEEVVATPAKVARQDIEMSPINPCPRRRKAEAKMVATQVAQVQTPKAKAQTPKKKAKAGEHNP